MFPVIYLYAAGISVVSSVVTYVVTDRPDFEMSIEEYD